MIPQLPVAAGQALFLGEFNSLALVACRCGQGMTPSRVPTAGIWERSWGRLRAQGRGIRMRHCRPSATNVTWFWPEQPGRSGVSKLGPQDHIWPVSVWPCVPVAHELSVAFMFSKSVETIKTKSNISCKFPRPYGFPGAGAHVLVDVLSLAALLRDSRAGE